MVKRKTESVRAQTFAQHKLHRKSRARLTACQTGLMPAPMSTSTTTTTMLYCRRRETLCSKSWESLEKRDHTEFENIGDTCLVYPQHITTITSILLLPHLFNNTHFKNKRSTDCSSSGRRHSLNFLA